MVHRVGRSICPGTREHPLGGHTTPPLTRTVYGPTQRVGVGNCTRSSHHDSHHLTETKTAPSRKSRQGRRFEAPTCRRTPPPRRYLAGTECAAGGHEPARNVSTVGKNVAG